MTPVIRPARAGEDAALTELAVRSKAHWGHDVLVVESDPDAEPFYLAHGAVRLGTRVSPATGRELPLLRIATG